MPRKSPARRIAEGQSLIREYTESNMHLCYPGVKNVRFINDMISRMNRKKGLSKRQRDWYDKLIEMGVPEPQGDIEEISRLEAAAKLLGSDGRPLMDFASRLRGGRELSEKQKKFAESLLATADSIREGTHWQPSPSDLHRLRLISDVATCYNSMYWMSHPSGQRCIQVVNEYLDGRRTFISEKVVESAAYAVRGNLRKIENPRFNIGDHCYLTVATVEGNLQKCYGIIVETPKVRKDVHLPKVVQACLVNGEVIETHIDNLKKRR